MDISAIRRLVIVAMFSDDVLMNTLVLKGGNALDLVYGLTHRSSVDIDFSVEDDFSDVEDIKRRIFLALRDRFDSAGFVVFDECFQAKPSVTRPNQSPKWGGYRVEFKIIAKEDAKKFASSREGFRRHASVVGEKQQRVFGIDISKHEFCSVKEERQLDDYTIYVYTLPMLALEKLRALCQQLPGYKLQTVPRARAQDFFDIHTLVTRGEMELGSHENLLLLRNIFAAKDVPIEFLGRLPEQRSLHLPDWPSIVASTQGKIEPFDFYFDYVIALAQTLKSAALG